MQKLPNVNEIMDKVFLTFTYDTSVREAVETLGKERLFGACVVDETGKLLGILSEKQCLKIYKKALLENNVSLLEEAKVTDIMYPEFKTVPPNTGIVDVAQIFLTSEFRRMPVVDSGKLVGQITRRDIVRAIQKFS